MKIKKLFPQNSVFKKSMVEIINKKGFYIILALCIAIIGITTIFVATFNLTSDYVKDYDKLLSDDPTDYLGEDLDADLAINSDDDITAQSSVNTGIVKDNLATANANTTGTVNEANSTEKQIGNSEQQVASATNISNESNAINSNVENIKLVAPVYGTAILEFAIDKLVYSQTLEEWRTHSGIDISADKGAAVKAVADGVVSEIKRDPRYGVTVIIDHQNSFKSVYCNLANDEMVNPNLIVKQGDVIGCVGNTAVFESVEQSHLHFEVLKDNQPVDPSLYLPRGANN